MFPVSSVSVLRLVEKGEGIVPPEEPRSALAQPQCPRRAARGRARGLFLEHGFEPIEKAIAEAFGGRIEYAATTHVDFKTELVESWPHSAGGQLLSARGRRAAARPQAHVGRGDRRQTAGVGVGSSKKAAEQEAAKQALEKAACAA